MRRFESAQQLQEKSLETQRFQGFLVFYATAVVFKSPHKTYTKTHTGQIIEKSLRIWRRDFYYFFSNPTSRPPFSA